MRVEGLSVHKGVFSVRRVCELVVVVVCWVLVLSCSYGVLRRAADVSGFGVVQKAILGVLLIVGVVVKYKDIRKNVRPWRLEGLILLVVSVTWIASLWGMGAAARVTGNYGVYTVYMLLQPVAVTAAVAATVVYVAGWKTLQAMWGSMILVLFLFVEVPSRLVWQLRGPLDGMVSSFVAYVEDTFGCLMGPVEPFCGWLVVVGAGVFVASVLRRNTLGKWLVVASIPGVVLIVASVWRLNGLNRYNEVTAPGMGRWLLVVGLGVVVYILAAWLGKCLVSREIEDSS